MENLVVWFDILVSVMRDWEWVLRGCCTWDEDYLRRSLSLNFETNSDRFKIVELS